MPKIELEVNGQIYTGWEQLTFSRSLEALAGKFTLDISQLVPLPIEAGDECKLSIEGKKVLTGWVDAINAGVSESDHNIQVVGRDKTADLVDCSAKNESQEFNNISFKNLLDELCKPFSVPVTINTAGLDPFKKFALQQESSWEAIERACRLRGVLATTTAEGGLIIEEYGARRATGGLTLGINLTEAAVKFDMTDRFSEYKVYGQQQGDDDTGGKNTSALQGTARDKGVKRYRPLIVMAEGQVNNKVAQARAEWEATVRAARGFEFTCTAPGWLQSDKGALWEINQIAKIIAPQLGVNNDLLIKEIQFRCGDGTGTVTDLTLTRADAYKKQPDLDEGKETGLKKGTGDDGKPLEWKDEV